MEKIADCGHAICTECFKNYLDEQVKAGPVCIEATCPTYGCGLIISDELYRKYISPQQFNKYKAYMLDSICTKNKSIKFCPGVNCSKIVELKGMQNSDDLTIDVQCGNCDKAFCFACLKGAHYPMECQLLEKW